MQQFLIHFEHCLCAWPSVSVDFQCTSTGIFIGSGMQTVVAVANLVGYYVVGLPVGVALMFAAKLRTLGNNLCVFVQEQRHSYTFSEWSWTTWSSFTFCFCCMYVCMYLCPTLFLVKSLFKRQPMAYLPAWHNSRFLLVQRKRRKQLNLNLAFFCTAALF